MSTAQHNANAYLRNKVFSASAEELRLMLLDGAIKFTTQGRDGVLAGDHEQSFEGFSQARAIIAELMTSMRPEVAPDLCERVRAVYSFLYRELVAASTERDASKADRVLEILAFERETWVMLMEQLRADRSAGVGPQYGAPRSISVQG
jgi:flagellar protein FliS